MSGGAWAVGGISGAALNPAVALGACALGALPWGHLWIYVLAELAAGVLGAAVWAVTQAAEKRLGDLEPASAE